MLMSSCSQSNFEIIHEFFLFSRDKIEISEDKLRKYISTAKDNGADPLVVVKVNFNNCPAP
jgi:Holliday junction resolvase